MKRKSDTCSICPPARAQSFDEAWEADRLRRERDEAFKERGRERDEAFKERDAARAERDAARAETWEQKKAKADEKEAVIRARWQMLESCGFDAEKAERARRFIDTGNAHSVAHAVSQAMARGAARMTAPVEVQSAYEAARELLADCPDGEQKTFWREPRADGGTDVYVLMRSRVHGDNVNILAYPPGRPGCEGKKESRAC